MTEFLAAWDKSREPSFAAFRIVGPASSPRAHRLRDDLARAGVPYWSFDNRSEEGRRLLRDHNLEGTPLPVVLAQDGCSPPGTSGTGPSSGSPRPWAKAPPPSSSCTNTCAPNKTDGARD